MHFKLAFLGLCLASFVLAAPAQSNEIEKRDIQHGEAFYYISDGQPGSCGDIEGNGAFVVAIGSGYDVSQYCGQKVALLNTGGGGSANQGVGKNLEALIVDTCAGCGMNNIDLSVGAFEALAGTLDPGSINVDWEIL